MKRQHAGFLMMTLLLVLGSATTPAADPSADVRAVLASMEKAWNAGDMAGYLDAYARGDGMSLAFGNQSVGSWQELDTLFRQAYPDPARMGRFTIETYNVSFLRPDVAVAYGRFTHYFPHEIVHGGYSHVFTQNDEGHWQIRHERTSRGETETLSE